MKNETKRCDICGVSNEVKNISYNKRIKMHLCDKHYQEYKNYGKFLSSSQITINDMNEITIDESNKIAYIHLYDNHGIEINKTIIDIDDVEKCSIRRWRISKKRNKIYVVSGSNVNKMVYLQRYVLNYYGELEVDHIDGNSLNNTKENLRTVKRTDNITNVAPRINSKTQIRGVSYCKKDNNYSVDFIYHKQRFYFKPFIKIEMAVYLRYLCEINYCKDFRYTSNDESIKGHINLLSEKEKKEIENYFYLKTKGINVT
jgi:hypothetical protein